jgi:hypothetical protein
VAKRAGIICLLIYQAIFLNVVLPGHTRGAITLTGNSKLAGILADGCCPRRDRGHADKNKIPTPKDRENCALCHMAARITAAPAVNLTLPKLGLTELLSVPAALEAEPFQWRPIYYGRAPPVLS